MALSTFCAPIMIVKSILHPLHSNAPTHPSSRVWQPLPCLCLYESAFSEYFLCEWICIILLLLAYFQGSSMLWHVSEFPNLGWMVYAIVCTSHCQLEKKKMPNVRVLLGAKWGLQSWKAAARIALRDCSKEAEGKVSVCVILVKGESVQSSTFFFFPESFC